MTSFAFIVRLRAAAGSHLPQLLKLRIERIDPGWGLEQFSIVASHTEPLDAVDLDSAVLEGGTAGIDGAGPLLSVPAPFS
jgi:hypothetical protein